MDRLDRAGMKAILATPSGAKPAWMSRKYPEILRCGPDRVQDFTAHATTIATLRRSTAARPSR